MPRFSDSWVLEKTMFTYLQGGSQCACCAAPLLFKSKTHLEDLIRSMSDLEPDEVQREIYAMKNSPWPEDMKDEIWTDRVLLQYKMKKEMHEYRSFFEEIVRQESVSASASIPTGLEGTAADEKLVIHDAIPILFKFCSQNLSTQQLYEIFQLPKTELNEILKRKYKICSSYNEVFNTVVEQVENFGLTGYEVDSHSSRTNNNNHDEEWFEKHLRFEEDGRQFCIDVVRCELPIMLSETDPSFHRNNDTNTKTKFCLNEQVLLRFLHRMVALAGPSLLPHPSKFSFERTATDNSESIVCTNIPNFRSDRRMIRIIIARCWADKLIEKYQEWLKSNNE